MLENSAGDLFAVLVELLLVVDPLFSRLRFLRLLLRDTDSLCFFLASDAAVAPLTRGIALLPFLFRFFVVCFVSDFIVFDFFGSGELLPSRYRVWYCLVLLLGGVGDDCHFVVVLSECHRWKIESDKQ